MTLLALPEDPPGSGLINFAAQGWTLAENPPGSGIVEWVSPVPPEVIELPEDSLLYVLYSPTEDSVFQETWIGCPMIWVAPGGGGTWTAAQEAVIIDMVEQPLLHVCSLKWGHDGDHVCGCVSDVPKPHSEGDIGPPMETVDPDSASGILTAPNVTSMRGAGGFEPVLRPA